MTFFRIHKIVGLLKSNKFPKSGVLFLFILLLIILFSPFIANDKPLVCKYKNTLLFPAFSTKHHYQISENETINYDMGKDWKSLQADFILFPLCAYSPKTIDAENPYRSPFDLQQFKINDSQIVPIPYRFRHWLGTTQNGTDVLSAIIHGTKNSLSIGFWSMLCAGFIGVLLGAIAGYFGNQMFKLGLLQLIALLVGIVLSTFYAFVFIQDYAHSLSFTSTALLLILFCFLIVVVFLLSFLGKKLDEKLLLRKQYSIPFDVIISKWIEVLNSLPSLLIIIAITAIIKPSILLLILVIGFFSTTSVARITRAEFLKARELNYVLAYKAMGLKNSIIIFRKILPNILPVILVQLLFVMMGAIIIESSLSFIGIGIPNDFISWGSTIAEAKEKFSAWWLVVFPGCCIFLVLYYCNKMYLHLQIKK